MQRLALQVPYPVAVSTEPIFEPGQRIILEQGEGERPDRYYVIIEAALDKRLLVAAVGDDDLPSASEGKQLRLLSVQRNGVFTMDCWVFRRGERTLALDLEQNMERIERRQYVRVESEIQLSCLMLDEINNIWVPFNGKVTDISAGGMAMSADVIAPKDSLIVSSIAIPGERPVVAVGNALLVDQETRNVVQISTRGPAVRVQFSMIREAERERLMRFIFTQMMHKRRAEAERE